MKNFEFLIEIEDNIDGLNQRNKRNFEILKSFITEAEDKLMLRDFDSSRLTVRMMYEALVNFVYNEIYLIDAENASYNKVVSYSNLLSKWDKEREDSPSGKYLLSQFANILFNESLIDSKEKDYLIKLNKDQNINLHLLNNSKNTISLNDGTFINDKFIIGKFGKYELTGFIGLFHYCLSILSKILYPDVIEHNRQIQFDFKQYDDGKMALDHLYNKEDFLSIIGEECVICEQGRLKLPDRMLFPNGPFLICDNANCQSILSTNLNLKERIESEGEVCSKCNSGTIKRTASYSKENKYYKRPYLMCNECKELYE